MRLVEHLPPPGVEIELVPGVRELLVLPLSVVVEDVVRPIRREFAGSEKFQFRRRGVVSFQKPAEDRRLEALLGVEVVSRDAVGRTLVDVAHDMGWTSSHHEELRGSGRATRQDQGGGDPDTSP